MAEKMTLAGNSIMLNTVLMFIFLLSPFGLIKDEKSAELTLTSYGLAKSVVYSTSFRPT